MEFGLSCAGLFSSLIQYFMKVRIKLTTTMTIVHCRRPLTILSIEARYHCASNHNIQALAGHVTNYILTGIPHLSHRHTHIESELRCTHKLYVSISIFRYFRQTTLLLAALTYCIPRLSAYQIVTYPLLRFNFKLSSSSCFYLILSLS